VGERYPKKQKNKQKPNTNPNKKKITEERGRRAKGNVRNGKTKINKRIGGKEKRDRTSKKTTKYNESFYSRKCFGNPEQRLLIRQQSES